MTHRPLTLYSLRSEIDHAGATHYRITKFVDGEPEVTYATSRDACTCPAGLRPTCRHRQMLPHMLNASIANTHWFYEFDRGAIVDFEGTPKQRVEALTDGDPTYTSTDPIVVALTQTPHPWRRL